MRKWYLGEPWDRDNPSAKTLRQEGSRKEECAWEATSGGWVVGVRSQASV